MNTLPGWAVRHPGLAVAAKITLCAVLLFLVSFEGVVLAQQPSRPHAIVWASGIIVCLCVVPYTRVPLVPRACVAVAAGVHRIVREALTNIRKHAADATAVRIGLRSVPEGLELRITDDGTGAARLSAQAFGGGYGLVGLQERAEALGGELTAGPAPEGGWQILATLSLDA